MELSNIDHLNQIRTEKCSFVNPLSPHDALKHHFTSLKTDLIFPTTKGFRMKISIKLFYQYMASLFNC